MQPAKEFSVRLVNKPGRLSTVLSGLAKEKVNLRAVSVMDTADKSALRFVADDPELAKGALDSLGIPYTESDVLAAELSSRLGSLKRVCERLAAEHVNIEYAYGSAAKGDNGLAVLRVNNLAKAQRVLDGAASDGRQRTKPVRRKPARAR